MYRIILLLVLALGFVSTKAHAGLISDTFSGSVFGVKWTDDVTTVKSKFPGGKLDDKSGILIYSVRDGREVLKTKRTDKNKIIFSFDATEKLSGVGVDFPYNGTESFSDLLNKMTTYFGTHTYNKNDEIAMSVFWPADDGIKLTLTVIPKLLVGFDLLMSIERVVPVEVSKERFGF